MYYSAVSTPHLAGDAAQLRRPPCIARARSGPPRLGTPATGWGRASLQRRAALPPTTSRRAPLCHSAAARHCPAPPASAKGRWAHVSIRLSRPPLTYSWHHKDVLNTNLLPTPGITDNYSTPLHSRIEWWMLELNYNNLYARKLFAHACQTRYERPAAAASDSTRPSYMLSSARTSGTLFSAIHCLILGLLCAATCPPFSGYLQGRPQQGSRSRSKRLDIVNGQHTDWHFNAQTWPFAVHVSVGCVVQDVLDGYRYAEDCLLVRYRTGRLDTLV